MLQELAECLVSATDEQQDTPTKTRATRDEKQMHHCSLLEATNEVKSAFAKGGILAFLEEASDMSIPGANATTIAIELSKRPLVVSGVAYLVNIPDILILEVTSAKGVHTLNFYMDYEYRDSLVKLHMNFKYHPRPIQDTEEERVIKHVKLGSGNYQSFTIPKSMSDF